MQLDADVLLSMHVRRISSSVLFNSPVAICTAPLLVMRRSQPGMRMHICVMSFCRLKHLQCPPSIVV